MTDKNKLPLTSTDVTSEVLAQLREIAPQVFTEGGVDFDKLKATLGESIVPKEERYGLNWAGKSEAFRNVQIPSVGTLLPQPEESVNFDTSENLIIEGDNLEVLKLLQKSYHGKVKMIYIDPPYNTGNEFIYPDNYHEGLGEYLKYSGQVNHEGQRNSSETDTSGRFHSKWLNMLYPRLFLARNLLRDDGVIFVSIDNNEVHNLRMLMDEVFGEENFVENIVWEKKSSAKGVPPRNMMVNVHEYILAYQKSDNFKFSGEKRDEEKDGFKNPDNDPRGPWRESNIKSTTKSLDESFTIVDPNTGHEYTNTWAFSRGSLEKMIAEGRILWKETLPKQKEFMAEMTNENKAIKSSWGVFDPQSTTVHLKKLMPDVQFDNPKPLNLMDYLLRVATLNQDIILDFFAGSGTTAQSVMQLNNEDGGSRRFILVQLPEKTDNLEYQTISKITRERVKRVTVKLNTELPFANQDRGFKAFKLTSSNFKIWNADTTSTEPEAIAEQLRLYADNVERERSQQDILYELVLKSGLPLSAKVEQIEVAGKPVYSIAQGQLLICLEDEISQAVLRGMIAISPIQMVCLDRAFGGNDQNKTNTVLEAKSQGVTFRTV